MKLCTRMIAATAMLALAMVGCGDEPRGNAGDTKGPVGSLSGALSLPDGSDIDTVSYSITGPAGYSFSSTVPVTNSTTVTFRKGGIPAGMGYAITLSATTSLGQSCMGTSLPFEIRAGEVSRVQVTLVCGGGNPNGDLIVEADVDSCPVITSLSAIPLETRVGTSLTLTAAISYGSLPVQWTGAGGTFEDADAYETDFTCGAVGTHVLTVAINGGGCDDAVDVEVSCAEALVYVPFCRNGIVDAVTGEECDDDNAVNDDACSNACTENECGNGRVDPGEACDGTPDCSPTCALLGCGDGITSGTEECDDGNVVNDDACTNTCLENECGNGRTDVGEECDDGNAVDDDLCANACTENECGNGRVDPGEECDGTAGCTAACTLTVDTCPACRATYCTDYQGSGTNLVAGCFTSIQAGFDIVEPDPSFIQDCTDAVACAKENDCGYNLARGPVECYCGSRSTDDCQTMGPGPDADCVEEWTSATRGATTPAVLDSFSLLNLPSGWAYYLITCETENCDDTAAGDCTPN